MKSKQYQWIIKKAHLVLFALLINGSLFAQRMEYYRHLVFRESPYSDIRGNHQIDRETSAKETHYRFVYDDKDRLVEVSHRLGDFIINDNDNWDSFIWFGSKMTIEYSNNQEVRYYYNRLDERIEAHGKMYKAVFTLDENGRRTSVKFYDKDGKPSENAWHIHRYEWTDLGDGNVLEKRFDLKNESQPIRPDFTFHAVKLEYGNDDLLDFVHHLDDNGNYINNTMKAGMDRIVYDQEENFSRWMVFDKDLKPVEGNAPEWAIGEHLYDSRGNKVELRGFDVTGRNKAMPTGVARVLNTYDRFNNQVEVKILDLDDNVLEHVKREYSKDGRRITWLRFYDAEGNLTVHPRAKFAQMKFEYGKDGSMIGRKFYDDKLNEVEI
ncbi:MAG: hypothetical protein KDD31_03405 [Muricauda sp.]|nr:hypothetical protein [Allomuricauda sp.]